METQNKTEDRPASERRTPFRFKMPSPMDCGRALQHWAVKNCFYILAFCIPVVLTYIAYAIFGLYPFGEESVLALDLNAQYVYYFEHLRDVFWGDGSFFYSWSRNLSGEYMGIIGYYLASPFTLIVMLLPEKCMLTSLLLMILAKIGTAGVTFNYYLQKSKKLPALHATIFSTLYAMMAYMIIQTIDPMWLDGLVMLPLIILGLEYLVDDGRKLNYIIPIAIMFVANFYIGYMIGIFTAFYFLYYLFFGSEVRRRKIGDYLYTFCNFTISTLVSLMCAAFMLLPVYNALQLGKLTFTDPDYSFKLQFDPLDVLAQLLTCQYDSVNVQGSPEIYCGILTVVLLPLFFLNSQISRKLKLGNGLLLAVMFFSMYIKPVDMLWHGGQVPNWLPFRYSFVISFLLLSMAAVTFEHLGGVKLSHFGGVFFGILALLLFLNTQGYEHLDVMSAIWLSIGLAGIYLLLLYRQASKETKRVVPILLLCVLSGELVFNAVHTMQDVDDEVAYSNKSSYTSFVQSGRAAVKMMERLDDGLYRSEKTFTRCVNDNLAFGLKGITHSSSVMNTKTLDFIETLGYCKRSYYTRYEGTTELADSLLGIKYVLDRGDKLTRPLLHSSYQKVADYNYEDTEETDSNGNPVSKTISIYRNPNALSIAYMVNEDLLLLDHLGNDNPFNSQNILLSTMVGSTTFETSTDESGSTSRTIGDTAEYYTRIEIEDTVLGAVTESEYTNGQTLYTKLDSGDPTIDYRFTVTEDSTIYCYLKTESERIVNLWLGTWSEELQDYSFKSYGTYFNQKNYGIIEIGSYEPGTKLALRLTIQDDSGTTVIKEPYFYYFEEDAFQKDIDTLKDGQFEVTKYTDSYITGTVTAQEGEILFTTIPYQEGWTVKVDGKKVDTTECLNAMIYVELTPGTHTVTFSYIPPGFIAGLILLVLGVGMVIIFYRYDRKNNKVLLARYSKKK
jgi:uncharacterized membrane protein YfhO